MFDVSNDDLFLVRRADGGLWTVLLRVDGLDLAGQRHVSVHTTIDGVSYFVIYSEELPRAYWFRGAAVFAGRRYWRRYLRSQLRSIRDFELSSSIS